MAISPLTSIITDSLTEKVASAGASQAQAGQGFSQVLNDVIANAEETDAQTKVDAYNLSIGNMDDMHTMMINMAKADIALQTMVQLRNKALSAYTEVMSTSL